MIAALGGMFALAFIAATLLPAQSELLFLYLLTTKGIPWLPLLIAASAGNTLGSVVNYALGTYVTRFSDRRWFPATPAQMARAEALFNRWGIWLLLLSWAPLGDAVTVVAGILRVPFWIFLSLVALAKTGRYTVLMLAAWGIWA
ncbi:MAG: YqaA family protein [Pseudorhodobacter sp.]